MTNAIIEQDDLLTKLAKKTTEQAKVDETKTSLIGNNAPSDVLKRGEDLVSSPSPEATKPVATTKDENTASTASDDDMVSDPNDWSKESALKEVKKLRQENKGLRIKYQEKIDQLTKETNERMAALEQQYKDALEAKKKLEEIEAKEADKKRNLEEKIAHRDALLREIQAKMESLEKSYQDKIASLNSELEKYRVEREAELDSYRKRVQEELEKIPEEFREFANSMVRGYGDPREALLALNEANLKGLFKEKTVVVNHNVPGAKDGARASKERLDAAAQEIRSRMSSSELIRQGLKEIREGKINSAFRTK